MEWHHLHQSTRANEAARARIEIVSLDEHHPYEKSWIDLLLATFCHDSLGNSICNLTISGVAAKNLADPEWILGRFWSADDSARHLEQSCGPSEFGVLVLNGVYSSAGKQNAECHCLHSRAEQFAESRPIKASDLFARLHEPETGQPRRGL
jgi:hypothetical protein